jgi:hypothetical protein
MSSASEMAAEVVAGAVVAVVSVAITVVVGAGIESPRETSETVIPATAMAPARP